MAEESGKIKVSIQYEPSYGGYDAYYRIVALENKNCECKSIVYEKDPFWSRKKDLYERILDGVKEFHKEHAGKAKGILLAKQVQDFVNSQIM